MQANKIKAEVLKSIFEKNYLDNPYELETIIDDLTTVYFDFTQLMADIPDRDQLPPQDILGRDLFTIRFLRDIFKEIIKADQVNQTPTRGHQRPIRSRSEASGGCLVDLIGFYYFLKNIPEKPNSKQITA